MGGRPEDPLHGDSMDFPGAPRNANSSVRLPAARWCLQAE